MSEIKKILIVDDEPIGRQLLEAILFPEGYSLFFAEDGEKAFNETTRHIPDLVLLDVMMPKMDGFEVCKKIRNQPETAHIPVFLITALDDRDSKIRGIDAGADDYISKPFDRMEILAKVKNSTALSRLRNISNPDTQPQVSPDYTPNLFDCMVSLVQKPFEESIDGRMAVISANGSKNSKHLFGKIEANQHQIHYLLSNTAKKRDNQIINCILTTLIHWEVLHTENTASQIVQQVIQKFNNLVNKFKLNMQDSGIALLIFKSGLSSATYSVSGINQVVYSTTALSMLGSTQHKNQYQPFYLMGNQDIEISEGNSALFLSSNLHKTVSQQDLMTFLNNQTLPENKSDISNKFSTYFKEVDDYLVVHIGN